ncbi:MAG: Flp pilus assembly complex ATPase component TadA, partial [Desulfovibrionaceae bacterium]|nr:Flp pilus assembly complex ATPase component TadA [Desulfovibrionaceae bacterium]
MERIIKNLEHSLGPQIMAALADNEIVEVMLNPDTSLWFERLGRGMEQVGCMDAMQSRLVLNVMASAKDTTVTAENPVVEGELPIDGSRFEGLLPPIVANPCFTIRKKARTVFTLEQYVEKGIMPLEVREIIQEAIEAHRNILVVGGTGSG